MPFLPLLMPRSHAIVTGFGLVTGGAGVKDAIARPPCRHRGLPTQVIVTAPAIEAVGRSAVAVGQVRRATVTERVRT